MLILHSPSARMRRFLAAVAAALVIADVAAASALAAPGTVYTETNAPAGNAVQAFQRAADGTLTPAGTFATGGTGSSTPGGRQGAVALSTDRETLYAVNSGSNSVSALRVTRHGLALTDTVPAGGIAPVSVAESHGRVYVLNSGDTPSRGTPNVTEFIGRFGHLIRVPGGTRALAAGAAGTAQLAVAPGSRWLVVTERDANRLETLPLDSFGRPGAPLVTPSHGTVPFGFAFGHHGELVVSEAGASTVSTYRLRDRGGQSLITASLPVGQGAACWVAISPDGTLAYTGNAAGSISGFRIDTTGALTALNADGLTASLPAPFTPRDVAFDPSGRYLYAISPGGQVSGYRVRPHGSLQPLTNVTAAAGITGIATR